MLCDYGCGKEAIHTLKNGRRCCSSRPAGCDEIKKINSAGTKRAYATGKRPSQKVNYTKLTTETKDRMAWSRGKFIGTEFSYGGKGNYKGVLLEERGHRCEKCLLDKWLGQPITIELEHCDGNNRNNVKSNLLLLCPNCHATTPTWRGRNINSGKVKVTDEELLTAYKKCNNIRQALLEVGLAAKGGNYQRVKKLISNARVVELVDTRDLNKFECPTGNGGSRTRQIR